LLDARRFLQTIENGPPVIQAVVALLTPSALPFYAGGGVDENFSAQTA